MLGGLLRWREFSFCPDVFSSIVSPIEQALTGGNMVVYCKAGEERGYWAYLFGVLEDSVVVLLVGRRSERVE